MTINIPDEALEVELWNAFEKMPPTPNVSLKGRRKVSPVLHQIGYVIHRTGDLCVIMMIIYRAIRNEIEKRGIIVYNPKTDTWQGVNYNGD